MNEHWVMTGNLCEVSKAQQRQLTAQKCKACGDWDTARVASINAEYKWSASDGNVVRWFLLCGRCFALAHRKERLGVDVMNGYWEATGLVNSIDPIHRLSVGAERCQECETGRRQGRVATMQAEHVWSSKPSLVEWIFLCSKCFAQRHRRFR